MLDTYNEELGEEFEKLEAAKRKLKADKLDEMLETGETSEIKVSEADTVIITANLPP